MEEIPHGSVKEPCSAVKVLKTCKCLFVGFVNADYSNAHPGLGNTL